MDALFTNPDNWYEYAERIKTTDELFTLLKETFEHKSFNSDFAEGAGVMDVFFTLTDGLISAKRFEDYQTIRNIIRTKQPKFYKAEFQYIDDYLLKYALFINDDTLAKDAFEEFIKNPNQDIDVYLPLLRLIALYGKSDWVATIVEKNYSKIMDNADEYIGTPGLELAKYQLSYITESEYLKFKNTGTFDRFSWFNRAAKFQFDKFEKQDIDRIERALAGKTPDSQSFSNAISLNRALPIIMLGFDFSVYLYEKKRMPFIVSGVIWDLMTEYWLEGKKTKRNSFDLNEQSFDKYCDSIMGMFGHYSCNVIAVTYGAAYVYDFLYEAGLVNDVTNNTAISVIQSHKKILLEGGNYSWKNGFIKNWEKAENTTTEEHIHTLEVIEKSFNDVEKVDVQKSLKPFDFDNFNFEPQSKSQSQPKPFIPERPMNIVPIKTTPKVGRNEPCTCGSGKKYKNCCGR